MGALAPVACAVGLVVAPPAWAEPAPCAARIGPDNVVACARGASLAASAARAEVDALEGRRTAARPVLPSNPSLAVSAGRGFATPSTPGSFTWSAALSQEIEIAGQRSARLRSAEAEVSAQRSRVEATERAVAAEAWTALYDTLAAAESARLAVRLDAVAQAVARAAKGRAEAGAGASIDADVAEAASVRAHQSRLAAERRVATTSAALTSLLGLDPATASPRVEGQLVPLLASGDVREVPSAGDAASPSAARPVVELPQIRALEAERRAHEARADLLRRARVPNVTLSVFARNDWYDERVVGVGLSVPVPLPQPVGRTNAGEIAESVALGRRAALDAERLRRGARLDLTTARAELASREAELDAFPPGAADRAEKSLRDLADEIGAGRLAVRDAIVAEQSLIDLLEARVEAKRALCLASVDLARAAGLPLERGPR
jgi:cobalt-zinc-cadmium efflux system outer membrane protein